MVARLPAESVALNVSIVMPGGNIAGASLLTGTGPSRSSLALTPSTRVCSEMAETGVPVGPSLATASAGGTPEICGATLSGSTVG